MKALFFSLQEHPRLVALFGTVTGWMSVDFLRAAQVTAAILASVMTLCSIILIAPKVAAEIRRWFN